MIRTRLTLTLLAAALGGCATKPLPPREVAPISAGSFEVSWSADTGVKAIRAMHRAGNLLFVYGRDNDVAAFDTDGGLKFRATVGQPGDIVGPPVVGTDNIFFPTTATLEIYSKNGSRIRTQTLPQPVRSAGVINGDTLYVGTDSETGGRLAAIDVNRTFYIYRWTLITGIINTMPALFDNVVYAATEDGRVYAINPDRTPLWAIGPEMPDGLFHADGKIIAPLKADDGGVFVASTDTKLYCLAPNTGRIRWTYYAGTPLVNGPSVTADGVYQYVEGQGLACLPKKPAERTVTPKWTLSEGKQLLADDAKYAYVLTDNRGVAAVNKSDGSLAFRTRRSDLAFTVTNSDSKNAAVYAISDRGQIVCIKPVLRNGVVGELAMLTKP